MAKQAQTYGSGPFAKGRVTYVNGHIHTMERPDDVASSFTVENGVVVALGYPCEKTASPDGNAGCAPGPQGRVVDLQGAHVFPALIDAHLHLMDSIAVTGVGFNICYLENNRIEPHNLAGVEELIRRKTASAGPDDILLCSNYISSYMEEGRLPNRFELDEWAGGRKIWILNMDGHSSCCNTGLLKDMGLMDEAPDGILQGSAHDANLGRIADTVIGSLTLRHMGSGLAEFCNTCAKYGIGTVCALDGKDDSERDSAMKATAFLGSRMPIDVRLFPQYMDQRKLKRVRKYMRTPRVGGCMKWELDGSVGSLSAAFDEPFADGSNGRLYFDDDFLQSVITRMDEQGYQISAHAIGTRAIRQLARMYDQLDDDTRAHLAERRHRIDHCEFPSADTVPWLCEMKPYITIQPGFSWFDKHYLGGYDRTLTPEQIGLQIPLRTLMDAGVPLCGSSDSPVQSVDPFLQMRGMVEFSLDDQSLTMFEALQTYTANGGRMLGEAKGILKPGYEASFFITDLDLTQAEPHQLDGFTVDKLYLHGKPYRPLASGSKALHTLLRRKSRKI